VAVRTINVTKNIPPTITLKGKEIVSIKKNSIYIDDGIVAVDFLGKDISKDVKCFSKVDLSNVGTYPLFYIVKDDNKTIGVETRLISVNDHKKTLLK
ncbi:MAG: DUF5011 domain-containing protein, partial [Bacilli bacterium]